MSRREQLEAMLVSEPDDVFLNYALAKALAEEGRTDEALQRFRRTLTLDPHHVPSYFQMAQLLAALQKTQSAREALTTGLEIARTTGDAHAEREMAEFLESL